MPQPLLRCPQGHSWEPRAATDGAADSQSLVCPVCGGPEQTLVQQSAASHNADSATLAMPPRSQTGVSGWTSPSLPLPLNPSVPPSDDSATLMAPNVTARPVPPPLSATGIRGLEQTLAIPGSVGAPLTQAPLSPGARTDLRLPDATAPGGAPLETLNSAGPPSGSVGSHAETLQSHHQRATAPRHTATAMPFGYEILGELGRGGMGIVYKARQTSLNRLVALKMLLAGGYADESDLKRFRAEAAAVAHLQHPNIVQVYEVGEREGRPFFSLEYVTGGSLAQKIEKTPLPAREAARVVQALAAAMDCAHQAGIIHRDLKPANVLLTTDGVPKITDFGLAKRLAEEQDQAQTRTGSVMGTPSYMAPEQAQGQTHAIGPAADIYSLGAILYDLLTGRPPFRGETVLDTLMQVKTIEPVPPVRLQPKLARDLETITLKCLQKESARRYATAGALAEDLGRFLAGEPIRARPVPVWERAWKWARRHPAAAALVLVTALAVVGGAGGAVAFGVREARNAREATRLQREAEEQKQLADANFAKARAAVDAMLTRVGAERLAHQPRMEKVRRELLEEALKFYEQFLQQKATDPALRWEVGRAHQRAADIEELLGYNEKAEASYRQAVTYFADLAAEFPDHADYREDLAAAHNNLGILLQETGRTGEAEQSYRKGLTAYRELTEQHSGDSRYRRALAGGYHNLGALLARAGTPEAEQLLRRALELRQELAEARKAEAGPRQELARSHDSLGLWLQSRGQTKAAEQTFAKARDLFRELKAENPDVPDYRQELATSLHHLGNLLRDTDPQQAERAYQEALTLRTELKNNYPKVPDYRRDVANTYNEQGILHLATGRAEKADEEFRKALDIKSSLAAEFPDVPDYRRDLANTYTNRGALLQTRKQPGQAATAYRRAGELFDKLVADFPQRPEYQQERARAQLNSCTLLPLPEAVELCRRVLDLRTRLASRFAEEIDYQVELARAHHVLGKLLFDEKNYPEAVKADRLAIDQLTRLAEKAPGVPDIRYILGLTYNNLALVCQATADYLAAEQAWTKHQEVVARLKAELPALPVYHEQLAKGYEGLGVVLTRANKVEKAKESFQQAVSAWQQLAKADPAADRYVVSLSNDYGNLAALEETNGRFARELAYRRRVVELLAKRLADFPGRADCEAALAVALDARAGRLLDHSRLPQAAQDLREAIRYQKAALEHGTLPLYRENLCAHYLKLAEVCVEAEDHAGAAAAVAELGKVAEAGWAQWHRAAGYLGRCAALAAEDDKLAEAARKDLARAYGDQAVKLLRAGLANASKDAGLRRQTLDYLKKDPAFESLRGRDDFRKLLAEGETSVKGMVK